MKNIAFVIWMLGYPFLTWVCENYRREIKEYSTVVGFIAHVLMIFVWVFVGYLLYEKP